jgi:hypothetical protein
MVGRWTVSGTHSGPFGEIPATGKNIKISGVTISKISKKKIIEQWVYYNQAEVLRQLGLIEKAETQKGDQTEPKDERSSVISERIREAAIEAKKTMEEGKPMSTQNTKTDEKTDQKTQGAHQKAEGAEQTIEKTGKET